MCHWSPASFRHIRSSRTLCCCIRPQMRSAREIEGGGDELPRLAHDTDTVTVMARLLALQTHRRNMRLPNACQCLPMPAEYLHVPGSCLQLNAAARSVTMRPACNLVTVNSRRHAPAASAPPSKSQPCRVILPGTGRYS